jgi:hypothetical protein
MLFNNAIKWVFVATLGTFPENFWTSGYVVGSTWKFEFYWDSTGRLNRQYTNWAAGQPGGAGAPESCLALKYAEVFKWHFVECESVRLRYICEKKGICNVAYGFIF